MASPTSGPNSAKPTTGAIVGGVYNVTAPVLVDGQATPLQTDANGKLLTTSSGGGGTQNVNIADVNGSVPALSNPLPVELSDGAAAVGTPGNPLSVNVITGGGSNASVGTTGATAPTSATEVGIIDGTGKLQGASASNPVPTKDAATGATNATAPTSAVEIGILDPSGKLQAASNANPVPISGAMTTNTSLAVWNSSTPLNTVANVFANSFGANTVNIVVIMGSTITGGTMIIESSVDGSSWQTIPSFNPLSQTIYNGQFTFVQNTNNYFIVDVTGWTYLRVRLNNAITGTGTITLQTVTDALPQSANVQVNGSVTIGNIPGAGSPGTAVPGSALFQGSKANVGSTLPTAVTNGQLVGNMADKFGRSIVIANAHRDLLGTASVQSTSASPATLIAAIASTFNDIIDLVLTNESATPTIISISDGTTTYKFALAGNGGISKSYVTPLPATSVNTAWTISNSAAVNVDAVMLYVKNQ